MESEKQVHKTQASRIHCQKFLLLDQKCLKRVQNCFFFAVKHSYNHSEIVVLFINHFLTGFRGAREIPPPSKRFLGVRGAPQKVALRVPP